MTTPTETPTDQQRDGWHNYCERCHGRYWVRAADMGKDKMRRFTGRESRDLHECKP